MVSWTRLYVRGSIEEGDFLIWVNIIFFRNILHRQYHFQCSRLQLVEQWLLFHTGYNQHVMVLSLIPNYKRIYIKCNMNKPLSWKYRNQCTFGIRSYISYFRNEAAATIPVAKRKKVCYVDLFFIAGVCKRIFLVYLILQLFQLEMICLL